MFSKCETEAYGWFTHSVTPLSARQALWVRVLVVALLVASILCCCAGGILAWQRFVP